VVGLDGNNCQHALCLTFSIRDYQGSSSAKPPLFYLSLRQLALLE